MSFIFVSKSHEQLRSIFLSGNPSSYLFQDKVLEIHNHFVKGWACGRKVGLCNA